MWFFALDKMLEGYKKFIINNRTVQRALKDPDAIGAEAYERFVTIYSEYISELFDDMSRNVLVESIAEVSDNVIL